MFFRSIYGILTIALASLFLSAEAAEKPAKWVITMTWHPQAQFAGVYYAKQAGIFSRYGLDVEVRHKTAELSITDYLRTGRSHFIVAPLAQALIERSAGLPVVNIGQVNQDGMSMLIGFKKEGFRTLDDLKAGVKEGRKYRFAIWEIDFGMVPSAFLKEQKLNGEIIPLNTDIAMLLWGAVDLICAMEYNEYYQALAAGYKPDEILTLRMRDYGLNVPEDCIQTLEPTLQKYPEVCADIRDAILEGWREALKNPEKTLEYIRFYAERDNGRFDPAHQSWMLTVFGTGARLDRPEAGKLSAQQYDFTVNLLKEAGFVKNSVEFKRFFPELPGRKGEQRK